MKTLYKLTTFSLLVFLTNVSNAQLDTLMWKHKYTGGFNLSVLPKVWATSKTNRPLIHFYLGYGISENIVVKGFYENYTEDVDILDVYPLSIVENAQGEAMHFNYALEFNQRNFGIQLSFHPKLKKLPRFDPYIGIVGLYQQRISYAYELSGHNSNPNEKSA